MYDFDMETLLEIFEGDPAKLAEAFTSQLNQTLDARKQEAQLHALADTTAAHWNDLIKKYLELYPSEKATFEPCTGASLLDIIKSFVSLLEM